MKHLSQEIHKFGVSLVDKYCIAKGKEFEYRKGRLIPHWLKHHNSATGKEQFYPCVISVKPHTYEWETKVTGKNELALGKIQAKGIEIGKPVVMLFVDAKEGYIYGDFLGAMNKPRKRGGLFFPQNKIVKGGSIKYYAVDNFHTLFKIEAEDLTKLLKLHTENGTDENQYTIFD